MRRILFVSRDYASDFRAAISGMHQRMRMLLEAAAGAADALDILFYADATLIERTDPSVAQASLKAHWGIDANVRLTPRATMAHRPMLQTARAVVDFRAQEHHFRTHGRAQYASLASHLRVDTDLVVAHRLQVGAAAIRSGNLEVPVVMDLDDIEHRKNGRRTRLGRCGPRCLVSKLELRALERGELATVRACRTSFVCSETDRGYLSSRGLSNVTVVPNGMRFDSRSIDVRDPTSAPTLFFIGTYAYLPNVQAAAYLVDRIFPLVRKARPDARLLIVGDGVERLPSWTHRPDGVDHVGFVHDLAEVYRRATVVCCPVLVGGGTRIKLIEAAAAGKPIVSTTLGAEGLALTDGSEILLRDSPMAFALACVTLLDDPALAAAMGKAAYDKARGLYERSGIVDHIAQVYRVHARVQACSS